MSQILQSQRHQNVGVKLVNAIVIVEQPFEGSAVFLLRSSRKLSVGGLTSVRWCSESLCSQRNVLTSWPSPTEATVTYRNPATVEELL